MTDGQWTKLSLCGTLLCWRHKNHHALRMDDEDNLKFDNQNDESFGVQDIIGEDDDSVMTEHNIHHIVNVHFAELKGSFALNKT